MPSLLARFPASTPATCLFLTLVLTGAGGCGSRSDLDLYRAGGSGEHGGGGSGPTGTTTATSTGTATGTTTTGTTTTTLTGPVECSGLTVLSPLTVVPTPGQARAPDLALLPATGEALLGYIEAPPAGSGTLRFSASAAFGAWPPPFSGFVAALEDVADFAVGPGPAGPVGYIRREGDFPVLASQVYPDLVKVDAPFQPGSGEILFITAIVDRYLGAQIGASQPYYVLGVGSYQPNSLPQNDGPLVCQSNRILGAGVASGQGFLTGFTQPALGDSCNPSASGKVVQVGRYDSPPALGSFLEYSESIVFGQAGEAITHVGMAPASFGAWLVFQSDGSTSETVPPVVAMRLDTAGKPLPGQQYTPVMPGGVVPPAIAVAALGDNLAFAWLDVIDPGPPVIALQLVLSDGSLGPATSFPTNEAWATGRLRLLASPGQNSLLVAWETLADDSRVWLARIDCAGGQ